MTVARVSLEISAGGAETSILKGSGLGRKTPGEILHFSLNPSWVLGKAVPRQARRRMLSSDRLRWDAPVTKRRDLPKKEKGRGLGVVVVVVEKRQK